MNKRRLLKLAALLEADAKNRKGIRFNLGTWGEAPDTKSFGVNCKTTACAMGLAALSGAFRRQGLSYKIFEYAGTDFTPDLEIWCDGNEGGLEAAEKLFDISYGEAEWIFTPDHYDDQPIVEAAGERAVAKRIRDFVAGKDQPTSV